MNKFIITSIVLESDSGQGHVMLDFNCMDNETGQTFALGVSVRDANAGFVMDMSHLYPRMENSEWM